MLNNRDYTLIIDRSGSMSTQDQLDNKSRWSVIEECTLALARKCEEFDLNGLTVYFFSHHFKRYRNITSSKVKQIFQENEPQGGTNLSSVLQDAINQYFQRKADGQAKANGETILVITDGEPDHCLSVTEVIVNATQKLERDEELAISFIQVGSDPKVTQFLKLLDNQLQDFGAKFDIVDTVTVDDMKHMTLQDVLLKAIID
jgi:uncharacterized protein with von Willebrand factor type A (vWA) domain